jgi:hypothetical protein
MDQVLINKQQKGLSSKEAFEKESIDSPLIPTKYYYYYKPELETIPSLLTLNNNNNYISKRKQIKIIESPSDMNNNKSIKKLKNIDYCKVNLPRDLFSLNDKKDILSSPDINHDDKSNTKAFLPNTFTNNNTGKIIDKSINGKYKYTCLFIYYIYYIFLYVYRKIDSFYTSK